nr:MAG TPA: hypothetical protein [Caudoviricetes sp.]
MVVLVSFDSSNVCISFSLLVVVLSLMSDVWVVLV